jgi:nucleotide-binding universal stress UspA family protein
MITKILVPTDGSKPARKSVEYAVEFARQTGATIVLLSVVDKSAYIPQAIPPGAIPSRVAEPLEDYLTHAAESYLEDAKKICIEGGVPSKRVIRYGHPVEGIIKEAQKSKVDLILIGSHGRSALKAAVLGSIAFGVISKESTVPVLVVRK